MKISRLNRWFVLTVGIAALCAAWSSPRLHAASVPATILTQPTDQTVVELLPATFSVIATGSPPARLQWFRNNQSIPNATNATYTLLSTALVDEGSIFRVEASNTISTVPQLAISRNAVLHVTPDTAGPLLLNAATLSPNVVQLGFSEGIWPDSALGLDHYRITSSSGDLTVTNVAVVGNRILLGTTSAQIGSFYTVKVQGVRDVAKQRARGVGGDMQDGVAARPCRARPPHRPMVMTCRRLGRTSEAKAINSSFITSFDRETSTSRCESKA